MDPFDIAIFAIFVAYFLPTIIAGFRRHRNHLAIFLLNLLLGWTFLGWVVALVWSVIRGSEKHTHENQSQKLPQTFAQVGDRILDVCPSCNRQTVFFDSIKPTYKGLVLVSIFIGSSALFWVMTLVVNFQQSSEWYAHYEYALGFLVFSIALSSISFFYARVKRFVCRSCGFLYVRNMVDQVEDYYFLNRWFDRKSR